MDFYDNTPLEPPVSRASAGRPPRSPNAPRRRLFLLGTLVIAGVVSIGLWLGNRGETRPREVQSGDRASGSGDGAQQHDDVPAAPPLAYTFPTPRQDLALPQPDGIFMPTQSGRLESALFGMVRTNSRGTRVLHEGIDIAPLSRDRRGRALDQVFAAADGVVGYVNRVVGNSNYGLYVVLLHREPVGVIYTLYAHLDRIEDGMAQGREIKAGDTLGLMGNTPPHIIPVDRGHLHFEVGLIQNNRFDAWFRAQELKPDHGKFNGQNLIGINPLAIFRGWDAARRFVVLDHLRGAPRAFTLVFEAKRPIDFFSRYPGLWQGAPFTPGLVVLDVVESGVPVNGRMAASDEMKPLGGAAMILNVTADDTLAARRLITRMGDNRWELTAAGNRWFEMLTY